MTNTLAQKKDSKPTTKMAALSAGIALILMLFAAIYAFGYAHSELVVYDDAGATLNRILASQALFTSEIAVWGGIVLLDLVVAWAFYAYLKPIHITYALLSGTVRLIYTGILGFAVLKLSSALGLATSGNSAESVLDAIMAFERIWSIGLIIFGFHLLFTGLGTIKSPAVPKLISILLLLAGASYILVHTLDNFAPALANMTATLEMILALPMTVGEVGFGIWLLVKGRKVSL